MPQLHCYVSDDLAQQVQHRADQAGQSVSRYLADVLKQNVEQSSGWPEGYFDLFVPIEGAEIERAPQGEFEERLQLE